jgi:hypothetical protein
MDPDTTFNMFLEAVANEDRNLAIRCLVSLEEWYAHGGFRAKCPKNQVIPTNFITSMLKMLQR